MITLDLRAPDSAAKLYAAPDGAHIDILINNAGFGGHGAFLDRDLAADLSMINLNVKSCVALTHMIGKDMIAQGGGKILNVNSTVSYMPGPLQATKAYVSGSMQRGEL